MTRRATRGRTPTGTADGASPGAGEAGGPGGPPGHRRTDPPGDRVIGEVGSRLLFETDRVRVWELRLAPGEQSPIHRHRLDHLLVQLEGDRIAVDPEPDTEGEFREFFAADVVPGAVVPMRRGGLERAVNVGRRPYRELIVELKD